MSDRIDMLELVGETKEFFGVNGNVFGLGTRAFEALEDESDGYRSMLDHVREVEPEGLFRSSIAVVRVDAFNDGYSDSYKLVDVEDGHVWLEFGTENYDDYYPGFVFRYHPKEPKS